MKFTDLKVGQRVTDTWHYAQPIGIVVRVRATVAKIDFAGKVVTYDKAHAQFLKPYQAGNAGD